VHPRTYSGRDSVPGRSRCTSRRERRSRRRNRRLWLGFAAAVVASVAAGLWVAVASGKPTIPIAIAGRQVGVEEGTTLGRATRRFGLEPSAGNLLDVEKRVLRSGVFPGELLVNGRPASAEVVLRPGDGVGARDGADRLEPLRREVASVSVAHAANPQFFVNHIPGRSIVARGAVSHKLASARFVPDGPPVADRAVALTFDDGPSRYTARILTLLARFRVPATFFVVGTEAERYPALIRRELGEGMAVGNHTYDHRYGHTFAGLPPKRIRWEIARGQGVLARLGVRSVLFRPPGGTVSPTVLRAASAHGLRVVLWSVDARDWVEGTTADQIVQRVLSTVGPGSIIVLHDGGGDRTATVRALPAIIAGIRKRGLRFVALAPTG
jgi:peptidoglycan/xylan/chitin deacetylase (PgdA/CDA1 family)